MSDRLYAASRRRSKAAPVRVEGGTQSVRREQLSTRIQVGCMRVLSAPLHQNPFNVPAAQARMQRTRGSG